MFDTVKESLRARISPTSTHWAGLRRDVRARVQSFKKERDPQARSALEQDFVQVLTAWGLAEQDIPRVIRELRLRVVVLALPVLVCGIALAFARSGPVWLALVLVSAPCLLGMLTTAWRVSVLKNRCFTPLGRWLFSLFSLAQKGA